MIDARIALMGKGLDLNTLTQGFEEGQAFRQFYDKKQKQKHLNAMAKLASVGEKTEYAKRHGGYLTDDLIQTLHRRRADNQAATLKNLKTSAETKKLNAEGEDKLTAARKTAWETSKNRHKYAQDTLRGLSKIHDTTTPTGLKAAQTDYMATLGELTASGAINKEVAQVYQRLFFANPNAAIKRLEANFLSDADTIKATSPKAHTLNTGDTVTIGTTDPITGQWTQQHQINKGIDPTQQYGHDQRLAGTQYTANQNLAGRQYAADIGYQSSTYATDSREKVAVEKMNKEQLTAFAQGNNGKPMPYAAVKDVNRLTEEINTAQNTQNKIEASLADIENGRLNLGVLDNIGHRIRNGLGLSSEQSQAFERLQSNIHNMANQVMMDAKGVQTEGDAERAYKTIIAAGLQDAAVVVKALKQLRDISVRTQKIKQGNIRYIQSNYGRTQQQPRAALQNTVPVQSSGKTYDVGNDQLSRVAAKFGISPEEARTLLR